MAGTLEKVEFIEYGVKKAFRYHRSNLSEAGFGLTMAHAYGKDQSSPIMFGPTIS